MKIAVDVMGADLQPHELLQGIHLAAQEWPDTELIVVGDEKLLAPHIDQSLSNVRVLHAESFVTPLDKPESVRTNRQASMAIAGHLVKNREVDAMISAGNTGALVATGLLIIRRIEGIDRPALAPLIPTVDNVGILALDLGANMDADIEQLAQYAVMGSIYRQNIHGMPKPRVGLLNVGTEAGKGNRQTTAAYELFSTLPIHFIGNVEARDVLSRNCDVLICDGFAGNVLLKAMEGTVSTLFQILRDELTKTFWSRLFALPLRSSLRQIKEKYNYKSVGGGILLGVDGLCFKAHGSSDAYAIKNAVFQARTAISQQLLTVLKEETAKLQLTTNRK